MRPPGDRLSGRTEPDCIFASVICRKLPPAGAQWIYREDEPGAYENHRCKIASIPRSQPGFSPVRRRYPEKISVFRP